VISSNDDDGRNQRVLKKDKNLFFFLAKVILPQRLRLRHNEKKEISETKLAKE
jgi:hypothetical protein